MGMLAQAALQHIVITYDPTHGRQIFVNGMFTGDVDKETGGTLNNWDNSFAFVLGGAPGGTRSWQGTIRFAAIHNVALTTAQIQQNFAAGVGASYFLLFDVSQLINVPQSYIMFTAAQYDSYSYLFARPTFINLNSSWVPTAPIQIQGIRIGENGGEVGVDQAYIPLNSTVDKADYIAGKGQLLSPLGTVIPLQNGPANDQFFLTFAQIGTNMHTYTDTPPTPTTPSDLPASSDIGLRVWDELYATMAKATTVSQNANGPSTTYVSVQQALPNVTDISTLTSASDIAATQVAMQYCLTLVQNPAGFFPGMQFNQSPASAFSTNAGMDLIATPLIVNLTGQSVATPLASQPTDAAVRTELYNLITTLKADPAASTSTITAGACTAVLASGTSMLK
jgi:Concanavalin A-like lectin/glucanases superfamily